MGTDEHAPRRDDAGRAAGKARTDGSWWPVLGSGGVLLLLLLLVLLASALDSGSSERERAPAPSGTAPR